MQFIDRRRKERKISNRCQSLVVVILLVVGIALVAGGVVWVSRCPSEVEASTGTFESIDAGSRSSIQELSKAIRRCPRAELYRVIWLSPGREGDQSIQRQAIIYDRPRKRLGYEFDIYSGIAGRVYVVNDDAIHKVAKKGGSLEDFVEYDQSQSYR